MAASLVGGQLLVRWASAELQAGGDTVWFPGDAGLRGRCSPEAANLSDVSLALTLAMPIGSELAGTSGARFVNAEIVYTQALLGNGLLTLAAKSLFRRPRPFSYRNDRRCTFDIESSDANRSFFSGHASSSFATAVAGSLLLSERGFRPGRARRCGEPSSRSPGPPPTCGLEPASTTTGDIAVGAVVGTGVGIVVPVLHGASDAPSGSDLLAGAIGLGVGVATSQLAALGAEAFDPVESAGLMLSPLPDVGAVGLLASGHW